MKNNHNTSNTTLTEVTLEGEVYYKIANVHGMRPFFMSVVSDSNHWLFAGSNGGISAGRKNADFALFPYYTDDKIVENAENTGSKSIFRVVKEGQLHIWEPFSARSEGMYRLIRNLYKNRYGNKIIFEEINEDLQLAFSYCWNSSNLYGFVRHAVLTNLGTTVAEVSMLDGLQNVLPYGVGADLQTKTSNLADAYKRSELIPETGMGIFALSAIIVDKAEPSEALKANVAWQVGLQNPTILLSHLQLNIFRQGLPVQQETDIKGERGCYLLHTSWTAAPGHAKSWTIIANVNQSLTGVIQLSSLISSDSTLLQKIKDDVDAGTRQLLKMIAAADGLQHTADGLRDTRHYSNVLFNIMRGGIFDDHYQIEKWDFESYLRRANHALYVQQQALLESLPAAFSLFELKKAVADTQNADLKRLATEYLPLKFSRRHGDPSRPWNQFSINIRSEANGSKILDYQGNWRDIFQNWEALALAYPAYLEAMIYKFLNASTFDGYNPYRVTKDGFDWETIEPDNPWSYIGYWGDHQVIYLLKFFEWQEKHAPGSLIQWLQKGGFVYAHVPYRIKGYRDILSNPKDTIEFDHKADLHIRERMAQLGSDGALLTTANGQVLQVSFTEKLLATVLAKLTNLVPGGGIWMNTQRPEWNDANNALVGNGLSMVTLCYLRRFLAFFDHLLNRAADTNVVLSIEMADQFLQVKQIIATHLPQSADALTDTVRKIMMDALGNTGAQYRNKIYAHGFSGKTKTISVKEIQECFAQAQSMLEHAIKINERADGLYHTYNLLSYSDNTATVSHLSEMLEGQVAVLSSGYLTPAKSAAVLDALQNSALYRPDQHSYILYPNKDLPGFLQKNTIPAQLVAESQLLSLLVKQGHVAIIEKDVAGQYHFNGNFRNANDLQKAIEALEPQYQALAAQEKNLLLNIFEQVFVHKEFTGRSGTFFGYEGLGSIYWHMVSKLLLAAQEVCMKALHGGATRAVADKLVQHYYAINDGIGVHKPVAVYGAYPTDPYSHTPIGKGAQQPGMTGQVKEDIICRIGELGIWVNNGQVHFMPVMLRKQEFTTTPTKAECIHVQGHAENIELPVGSLFFTYCQVPVVYMLGAQNSLEISYTDGRVVSKNENILSGAQSEAIWMRSGEIKKLKVTLNENDIRY